MHGNISQLATAGIVWLFITTASLAGAETPQRRVAVTIDDLPIAGFAPKDSATRRTITTSLLKTLEKYDIPAIGFVNEHKLYVEGVRNNDSVDLLHLWLDAGMELGNHSFSHPDLHRTPLDEFKADVLRGELLTRKLLADRGQTLQYFRHPFLRTGRDIETKKALEQFLGEHGYRVAPVSLDNSDWQFARAYDLALQMNNANLASEIGVDYVDYMLRVFAFYEDQSQQLFERNISQVLLIHANQLNSVWFDVLAARLVEQGYQFISLGDALQDSAYASPDTFTGPGGITWLHRWAITRNVDPAMFRGEPETPPHILELTNPGAHHYPLWQESDAEKRVTFYTSFGVLNSDGWSIPVRLWVHEEPDPVRRLAARAARSELRRRAKLDDLDDAQKARFEFRADGFIADSESNEVVQIRFDNDPERSAFTVVGAEGKIATDRNGLLEGTMSLTREDAERLLAAQNSRTGWLTFRAMSEDQVGIGRIRLIPPAGLSVISDVDDTIKVTEIPLGEATVLNNTFFKEFSATPCMREMYRDFSADVSFHYVSGGPWQMYAPLARFMFTAAGGFPEGSFHMKSVRTNLFESESYRDIWRLIAAGSGQMTVEQKLGQISTLLRQFPERQFILIGDSGEKDPEIFAKIRQDFPDQIEEIRIRDVVNAVEQNPGRLQDMTIISPQPNSSGSCLQPAA